MIKINRRNWIATQILRELTLAHSSEKRHRRLLSFSGGTACLARQSLCALRQDFWNSVNVVVRAELSDCDRRTRCGVLDDETGGVIEFFIMVTRFLGASLSPFSFFSFESVWSSFSDEVKWPLGVSHTLLAFERRKRWAQGDRWASDSNISCFSFMTIVRSGLWPRYVWIVSKVKNSHCGSYRFHMNHIEITPRRFNPKKN